MVSAGAIATAQNADLLGRRGQWITRPTSSVCIKSLLGPKAVFGSSPRTPSSSLITALTTPYCHCLSPQPEGQLRAGRHLHALLLTQCLAGTQGPKRQPSSHRHQGASKTFEQKNTMIKMLRESEPWYQVPGGLGAGRSVRKLLQ